MPRSHTKSRKKVKRRSQIRSMQIAEGRRSSSGQRNTRDSGTFSKTFGR